MEPLDEKELKEVLGLWQAPAAPTGLARRVFPQRKPWWRWLLTGTIRIPVPVGLAMVMLLAFWLYSSMPARRQSIAPLPPSVSLADFQPVQQLEPVVFGGQP